MHGLIACRSEKVSLAVQGEARDLPPRARCLVHASSQCIIGIYFYSSYVLYLNLEIMIRVPAAAARDTILF